LPMAVEGRYINTWIQYNTIQYQPTTWGSFICNSVHYLRFYANLVFAGISNIDWCWYSNFSL